jgi:hypothetical protein
MKKSLFIAIAALGLMGMGSVSADIVCKNCEYLYYGRYLGAYWPGDRATFGNRDIGTDLVQLGFPNATSFGDYWIFDLNNTAEVSLTADLSRLLTADPPAIEIYLDEGSVCGPQSPAICSIRVPLGTPLISQYATRRWTGAVTLPPGRYVIRVVGYLRLSGETAYNGTMVVRVPR